MKRSSFLTLTLTLLLAVAHSGKAQVKAFEQFRNTPDVSYVYVSQTMLRMAKGSVHSNIGNKDINLGDMIDKLNALQVISTEKAQKVAEIKKMVGDIVKKDKYNLIMDLSEDNDAVSIYSHLGDKQSVVLMQTEDTKDHDLSLIVFSGTFTEDDLMNIAAENKKNK